jgi:hypothetical protein
MKASAGGIHPSRPCSKSEAGLVFCQQQLVAELGRLVDLG